MSPLHRATAGTLKYVARHTVADIKQLIKPLLHEILANQKETPSGTPKWMLGLNALDPDTITISTKDARALIERLSHDAARLEWSSHNADERARLKLTKPGT